MKRTTVLSLLLLGLIMLFLPNFTIAQLSPLCISQFALANQACAVLPSSQAAPSAQNQTRSQDDGTDDGSNSDDDDDDDDDDYEDVGDGNGNSDGDERERRHKHGKKHRGRKHGKHGGKHGDHKEPRANKDCCRWLEELNESCVCGALLRLPPFLVKPKHEYSIKVGKSCKFTYNCYGV